MLHLDPTAGTAFYEQLYEQLRRDILAGAMPSGMRLPSIRALSAELGTSRNTVESAYAQLVLEGYITARPGSGYTVAAIQHDMHQTCSARHAPSRKADGGKTDDRQEQVAYDFHYGNLDAATFPYAIWRRILADILKEAERGRLVPCGMHIYGDAHGHVPLRRELANYLYRSRGVRCSEEQIVICGGLQPSIITLVQLTRQDGNVVAIEDPTYTGAKAAYQCLHADIVPIPVEHDGIDVRKLKESSARLVHVTPSHQFPTGVVMPIGKRVDILNWASQNDIWIVEDDYDSELRYSGRPIHSLQSIDGHGRVIYLGTFSKALSPGMRMSYMVLPPALADRFGNMFSGFQCPVPWLEQAALSRFMAEGYWEKHLRKICLTKKRKHDVFVGAINRLFGNAIRVHGHNAGLHLLLTFPEGTDEAALVASAAEHGVRVYSASPFWTDKSRYPGCCLFIGYGMLSEDDIVEALTRLRRAWTPILPA